MPTTSNFGWTTPADTDLVKDGAAAIRTLGNGVDTSFVDLKGGTTGQVLAKASNTDLDFTWTADASGIPATIFDAKGDLIAASAADTAARLAVGSNNQVLTADSTTATGLKWATPSSGSLTQLASGTLSGSAVSLTSISNSYIDLRLVIRNFKPATDNTGYFLRFNSDSGTNYGYSDTTYKTSEPFSNTSIPSQTNSDNTVANGFAIFNLFDYANTATYKFGQLHSFTNNPTTSANFNYQYTWALYSQTGAINAISINCSSGNFTSGDYILYGVK